MDHDEVSDDDDDDNGTKESLCDLTGLSRTLHSVFLTRK
jgi:hypothetical protein